MPLNKEDIKAAISECLDEKLKDFWIERERHYKDHEFVTEVRESNGLDNHKFISEVRSNCGKAKIAVIIASVTTLLGSILALIKLGFIVWTKGGVGK